MTCADMSYGMGQGDLQKPYNLMYSNKFDWNKIIIGESDTKDVINIYNEYAVQQIEFEMLISKIDLNCVVDNPMFISNTLFE